ncbi:MAG: hypothetical protein KDC80_06055 [Saprospiraceae bacterium]|nr:hypothetical protein [Saprospiraceae bacterium]
MNSSFRKILLIEDDPVICWFIQSELAKRAIDEIRIYDEFFSAFETLDQFKPDLIITNLRALDGWMDSFDFHLLVRHCRFLLVMTGLSDQRLHPFSLTQFNHGFLQKPFSSLQLKKLLNNA